jgi:hypothetical protein
MLYQKPFRFLSSVNNPAASDNDITIIVEASSGILRAVWARPLLTGSLINSYQHLLNEAVRAGCRFWQLDLRQRIWPAATFRNWVMDTFAEQVTQRLGGPVYVAFWVASHHQLNVDDLLTINMQAQVAKHNLHIAFFEKEPDARAWLVHQQAND